MKLTLSAKELLALHNLLRDRIKFGGYDGVKTDEGDPQTSDDVQLRQVFTRLRSCLVSALSGKGTDPLDAWFDREQAKIDRLHEGLNEVKQDAAKLAAPQPDLDECFELPDYPKPGPRGSHQGKNSSRRR
jgi:hypothetical protein